MIKRDYMRPTMMVVELKSKRYILVGSLESVRSTGLEEDELEYKRGGGSQSSAW